ncbi:hypothetical protein [Pollutibacter soli]|uniref:hypothetical protein n=1 Tax=Pollutibacter soli TaxID=3034157 RepID=UPI003013687A
MILIILVTLLLIALVIWLFDRRIKNLEKKTTPEVSGSIYDDTGSKRLAGYLVQLT